MFIDSHCHLDFEEFDGQRDEVLARARAAGVGFFLSAGTSMPTFPKILNIAESYDDVVCSVGVHPHEAEKPGEEIDAAGIAKLCAHPKVVAIGETGLDYFYDHAPREAQERNFRQHIRACIETGLPLIVHTRDAEDDTIRILRDERTGREDKLTGVLHCYSSNRTLAEEGLSMGFFFSFSGMLTFNKSENVREIARDIPMDKILVETDSPYLAPVPYRGKPCEPAYVVKTAQRLAELKNVPLAELERATTENFFRLFKKAVRI